MEVIYELSNMNQGTTYMVTWLVIAQSAHRDLH